MYISIPHDYSYLPQKFTYIENFKIVCIYTHYYIHMYILIAFKVKMQHMPFADIFRKINFKR